METYINYDNCNTFQTLPENWDNFDCKTLRDFSDFEAWALFEAWKKIFGENTPYIWTDGHLEMDGEDNENIELHLTHNGNLVLKVYDTTDGGYKQIEQHVVKMD